MLKVKPQIINEVRSDNFWTGQILKNILTDETIKFINLMNTETGVQHALLSNIELRTIHEENNPDTGLEIVESEMELRE